MKVIGGAPVKRRLEFDGSDDDPSGKMAAMQVMSGQTKGIFVMRRCLAILFFLQAQHRRCVFRVLNELHSMPINRGPHPTRIVHHRRRHYSFVKYTISHRCVYSIYAIDCVWMNAVNSVFGHYSNMYYVPKRR